MRKKAISLVLILFVLLLLTGCIPGDGKYTEARPAGFLSGIWHGWIAPLSLVLSFFNRNLGIYEVVNTGWWYDLGFYLAVISGFGGLSLTRNRGSSKK